MEIQGMSLRDWFAGLAPDVPDGFVHTPAPGHPGPRPTVDESKLPPRPDPDADFLAPDVLEQRERYVAAYNAAFDEIRPQVEAWKERYGQWKAVDDMARFAQWCWFYADQTLAARSPQPVIAEEKK